MKKIFVATTLLLTAIVFGCDQANMMKPVVKDVMEPEKESVPEPISVVSITHYNHWERTPENKIMDSVQAGTTVYTEIVFSDNVPLTVADGESASPNIYVIVNEEKMQYHIVPHGSSGEDFQSGDCKPIRKNRVFLCRYVTPQDASGMFSVEALTGDESLRSDPITVTPPTVAPPEETPVDIVTPPEEEDVTPDDTPVDYYAIVDAGLERVRKQIAELVKLAFAEGRPPDTFAFYPLYYEEFGVEYTLETDIELAVFYREVNGIEPNGDIPTGVDIAREYLKLRLEFPDETDEEIIERFKTLVLEDAF